MATQDMTEGQVRGSPDANPRGSIGLVLLVAVVLIGAAAGLLVVGRANAEPYILTLLSALAVIGVFSLFALAAGILRFAGTTADNPLLRGIVDNAGDAIAVSDQSGQVLYANPPYLELAEATAVSDARPVERVFVGDPDISESIYRLLKAAREGRRQQEEVRVAGPKGGPARWLRLRVRPFGPDRRDARLTVWAIADITHERQHQENIFQDLKHAIDYLDHAPAGFFSVDAEGNISYLNATLATWLDYDLAQVGLGGLKLADIVSGAGASLLTTFAAAPGDVKTEVFDLDLKTRGGRPLPVRLLHKVAFGADGTAGASRTLVLNRARDEGGDRERAAEVRFVRFFHNSPMAIAAVDRTGRITRSNALFARMFEGVLKSEGEDRSIFNIVNEPDRPALEAMIRKAADGQGDIAPVEAALAVRGDRWANFYIAAVEEADRDTEAAIVYALETTEQHALRNQFDQSQRMQAVGQLAGGIAHDFNNVLSAIMMATDFLLSAHKPTDPSFEDIMQIKQNTNRAASLVRQLLAFSRRQTLRPQVLDLGETLSDLTMLLRRLIGEKVTLDVVHGRDLWPVRVDISQFEQVIVNLAVNARDAMPDGGKLTLRTANVPPEEARAFGYKGMPAGEYVLVEVRDTGVGIPADLHEKIFEPFFSTKDVGKGTGLGLSTVYGIVKQTGGFIYVESSPGRETTFRIFLPRHVPGAEETLPQLPEAEVPTISGALAAVSEASRNAPTDLTGRGTILLVEDEEGLRGLNARGLASRGYTVLEAGNGVEAIEVLDERNGEVDLVVTDVVMPEMDGPTLFKVLRERNPEIKIVFVSGYAEDAFEKHLPENVKFAFLPKPFTLKQLVEVVKETMAS
jgi:two-component system cell cycle sensor histidine kinase/response regulator CckA